MQEVSASYVLLHTIVGCILAAMAFMLYRQRLQLAQVESTLEIISTLLMTWAAHWGKPDGDVREALQRAVDDITKYKGDRITPLSGPNTSLDLPHAH